MKMKIACAAAALIIGGALTSNVLAADPDPNARASLRANGQLSPSSVKEIQNTLGDTLNQIISKDFEDTVDNFTKVDRDRIGKLSESTPGAMKSLVSQLDDAWKSKYGHSMSLKNAGIPYEITAASADKVANVELPGNASASGITLRLVDEGSVTSKWRLDVPDSVTNLGLKASLETALQQMLDAKGTWPADERDAYRTLALKTFAPISVKPLIKG